MKRAMQCQTGTKHTFSHTSGLRGQATGRATRHVTPPKGSQRKSYQLTADASKGNAFCWLTWETSIDYSSLTRARARIDESAGDLEPAGVVPKRRKTVATPREVTSAGRMRARLKSGPASPAELARLADLQYPAHVRSYLKRDMEAGRVVIEQGMYCLTGNKK